MKDKLRCTVSVLCTAILLAASSAFATPQFKQSTLHAGGLLGEAITVPYVVESSDGTDSTDTEYKITAGSIMPEISGTIANQPQWQVAITDLLPGKHAVTAQLTSLDGTVVYDNLNLTILLTDGTQPATTEEEDAMVQAVVDADVDKTHTTASELIESVTGRFSSVFNIENTLGQVVDLDLLDSHINSELEVINEEQEELTEAEEAQELLELQEVLDNGFGGHSFIDVYTYNFLSTLADKHYSAGKTEAAELLYLQSLNFMSDVEPHVFTTLTMIARNEFKKLPENPTLAELTDTIDAAAARNLAFFQYFPEPTENFAGRVYTNVVFNYWKYFPIILDYDNYDAEAFEITYDSMLEVLNLKDTTANNTRFDRISAWELGGLEVNIKDRDGNIIDGEITITNTSDDSVYPNSEDRPVDIRKFDTHGDIVTMPVYLGHTYELTLTAKVPGSDAYTLSVSDFFPRLDVDEDYLATMNFTFDASVNPIQEPSLLVPAIDGADVDYDFMISRNEVRTFEYVLFLNALDEAGSLVVTDGVVSNSDGDVFCKTSLADINAFIDYEAANAVGSRFLWVETKRVHPVAYVSWYGAVAYCNWKSTADSLTPAYDASYTPVAEADGYRLPTQAEWRKAASWDPDFNIFRIYPTGTDALAASQANFLFSNDSFEGNEVASTPAVNYPETESAYGVHDAAGNMTEWSNDLYEDTEARVALGGSWGNLDIDQKSANTTAFKPDMVMGTLGFRITKSN